MNAQLVKPLVLAMALALAASGCSQHDQHGGNASPAPAPARSTAAASKPAVAPAPAPASSIAVPPAQPIAFTLDDQYKPCDDFDQYVNAKWNKANPIPADQTSWFSMQALQRKSELQQNQILETAARDAAHGQGSALEQKLGKLYAAGLDTAAINKLGYDPIKPELGKIDALKNTADIVGFIDSSFANGDGYVFSFGSGADQHDATKQIGYVFQGGLGLPTPAYYSQPQYKKVRDAYVQYVAKSFELTGTPAAQAEQQARSVLAFETELAKASLSPTALRNLDNEYHFVTLAEADKISPHFSWPTFFKVQGVDVGKGFSLSQPGFIKAFDKLLATAPMAQWQAYLKAQLISGASMALAQPFQDNHFSFYYQTLRGQPKPAPRWKRLVDAVNDAMGMGVGKLYVAKYFPPATKARAEQMVTNIRNALKEHIEQLTWMSAATKQKALKKWSLFLPKIGYPDQGEWRNYEDLSIVPGHWYANLQAAAKFNYHYDIGKIGTKTNRKEWFMTPQTVDAYYDPSTNTINFPAGILQPPFFFADGDDAVNYGGIGLVIGHESSHGFDDQGSQFDGYGNRKDWWSPQDRKHFDALTGALARQYDGYAPVVGKPDLHVNGKLTLGENIADLGGLNIAYTALQNALKANQAEAAEKIQGLTEDQRFFLSSARVWEGSARPKAVELSLNVNPHSPGMIRAFASASDMPQFARAFQCKPGAKMVGKDPVVIW